MDCCTRRQYLDILIATDDSDLIKIYADQVIAALESLASPKLEVKRISASHFAIAKERYHGAKKIVFLYDEGYGSVSKDTVTTNWIENFPGLNKNRNKFVIVNKANRDTDVSERSNYRLSENNQLWRGRVVSITDYYKIETWWHHLVNFLFRRTLALCPSRTADLVLANTEDSQSKEVCNTVKTLLREFDLQTRGMPDTDLKVLVLQKGFEKETASKAVKECLQSEEETKFGLHLICAHSLSINSDFCSYSNSVHNMKSILTAVLFILIDASIISARRVPLTEDISRRVGFIRNLLSWFTFKKARRLLAIFVAIVNIPFMLIFAIWTILIALGGNTQNRENNSQRVVLKLLQGVIVPTSSIFALIFTSVFLISSFEESLHPLGRNGPIDVGAVFYMIVLPAAYVFIWGTLVNGLLIVMFNKDYGVLEIPCLLWNWEKN